MARSLSLGAPGTVEVAGGRLAYRERGAGPPVVFVHGLLVNGDLWRDVVPPVAEAGFRCVVPDLPLGAHAEPMEPGTDLGPVGVADLLADFLEALDLRDVVLVANDTGGAIVQLLLTRRADRIARVVLTTSDSLERFFPPMFRPLQWLGHVPGGAWLLTQVLRLRPLHRLPMFFGWLTKTGLSDELRESFLRPARTSRGVRRDLQRFLRDVHPRLTISAAARFPTVTQPVLLAWSVEDRLFPIELGHRVDALFPSSRLIRIEDSYTFVPLDQPAPLATAIVEFIGDTRTPPVATA
jgi:pimeloyl-ACP methyl ester carboxylesterase